MGPKLFYFPVTIKLKDNPKTITQSRSLIASYQTGFNYSLIGFWNPKKTVYISQLNHMKYCIIFQQLLINNIFFHIEYKISHVYTPGSKLADIPSVLSTDTVPGPRVLRSCCDK